jgi:hypothetical protein
LDHYKRSVLDPARKSGHLPPRDLFVRYGLDPRRVRDLEEFKKQLDEVVRYWKKLSATGKLYRPLIEAMLAAHADLERKGILTPEAFGKQHEDSRNQARSALDQRITTIAAATPCVTLGTVARLVEASEGLFDAREVRDALAKQNVTVVDPAWSVPAAPPIPSARSLRAPLAVLGMRLSVEVVLTSETVRAGFRLEDGFRLSRGGERLTREKIDKARAEQAQRRHDERKTASENVLAILSTAAGTAGGIDALILWEVADRLRPDVAAGLPVRAVAESAAELGLDPAEAVKLAATLAGDAGGASRPEPDETQLVLDTVRAGGLREAQRMLAALPAQAAPDARKQVEEAAKKVADLVRAADAAQQAGTDPEEVAKLLADAVETAGDDDRLRARLARMPPPPATGVQAGVEEHRVTVRWSPSLARTGAIRYRVVRATGRPAVSASGGTHVAETEVNEAEDGRPPAAAPTYYTVFAGRGGQAWSAGASSEPITLVPEVTELVLAADERSVTGSWRIHPDTVEVEVTRTSSERGASPAPVALPAGVPAGFVDTAVRIGTSYEYRVVAVYRDPSGRRRPAAGVVASASPQRAPTPVRDLSVELQPGRVPPSALASWTPPAGGSVQVLSATVEPPWPEGATVPRGEAISYGRSLPGASAGGGASGARASVSVPVRHGRLFLTAVTFGPDHAVVGNTVTLSLVDPVTSLQARRLGDSAALRWIWPSGATAARVRWWPNAEGGDRAAADAEIGDVRDVSHREYADDGGVAIGVGPGSVNVSVQTVATGPDGETLSLPVTTVVAGRAPEVAWALRRTGFPGRRRFWLVLSCEQPCRVPALVVVRARRGRLPGGPHSGRRVAEIAPRDLPPGTAAPIPLGAAGGGRVKAAQLACFPVDDGGAVTLIPASGGRR